VNPSMWNRCIGALLCCLILPLGACASRQPDHFYLLGTRPSAPAAARTLPVTAVLLGVSLPPVSDRAEMMLSTAPDRIAILEHDRWAAPLSDLMRQTLARDLEARRSDLLVGRPGIAHTDTPAVRISVDILHVILQPGVGASIEAHWRIVDAARGKDSAGGDTFAAASNSEDYAALADSLSRCLGSLADRLIAQML
jgi:uncharacterized protein